MNAESETPEERGREFAISILEAFKIFIAEPDPKADLEFHSRSIHRAWKTVIETGLNEDKFAQVAIKAASSDSYFFEALSKFVEDVEQTEHCAPKSLEDYLNAVRNGEAVKPKSRIKPAELRNKFCVFCVHILNRDLGITATRTDRSPSDYEPGCDITKYNSGCDIVARAASEVLSLKINFGTVKKAYRNAKRRKSVLDNYSSYLEELTERSTRALQALAKKLIEREMEDN